MFFTLVGFLICLVVTFGAAGYILLQANSMTPKEEPFPVGAVISASIFTSLGFIVVFNHPFLTN